jgi:dihydroorotase
MELLIKNVRIVDSSQDFYGDVYIEDGKINNIGKEIFKDCKTIDGNKMVLMPSFVDLHCHFRDPGFTHKEDILSGSKAAVKGGFTAVNLMANTKPVCSNMDIVNYVIDKSRDINLLDVHQIVSITEDMKGEHIEHLNHLTDNVRFISDDGKGVSSSKVMMEAMLKAKEKGIIVISHAEDEEFTEIDMRLAEDMMTWRDLMLAKYTDCRLHMAHVSTKDAVKNIIRAKKEGVKITCEVTPHHIALNSDTHYRVNPPMREEEDVNVLIEAIKNDWVDAIATDHAPHTKLDKENGAPGISGLETAFSVCYTKLVKEEHITINKLSELMSSNPAKIMNLNKGEIKIGYDGDLVLVDLDKKFVINSDGFLSKGKNTPFNGKEVWGEVVTTIRKGRVVFDKGRIIHDNR